MTGSVSLTGKDVIALGAVLGGGSLRVLNDLADGDAAVLDFPNNIVEGKVGKNGNTLFAFNATGASATLQVRTILGSPDDKFLNAELNRYKANPATYTLLSGEFVKKVGDGTGAANSIIYKMDGGIIQKYPVAKENTDGDTEQSVAVWTVYFANNDRAIS